MSDGVGSQEEQAADTRAFMMAVVGFLCVCAHRQVEGRGTTDDTHGEHRDQVSRRFLRCGEPMVIWSLAIRRTVRHCHVPCVPFSRTALCLS